MSWDQGFKERDELPPKFVEWADSLALKQGWDARLEYISWFDSYPDEVHLDYGGPSLKLTARP